MNGWWKGLYVTSLMLVGLVAFGIKSCTDFERAQIEKCRKAGGVLVYVQGQGHGCFRVTVTYEPLAVS